MDQEPLARRIITLLRQLGLESDRYVQWVGARHALGRNDIRAIGVVKESHTLGEPVSPTTLAQQLGLSPPATTALIDRLVRAKHLVRQKSERDARRFELSTTSTAETVSHDAFAPLAAQIGDVVARLSETDAALVERFLTDVIEATLHARPGASRPPHTKTDRPAVDR